MFKKTQSKSLFADSPADIEAEKWKAEQKRKQTRESTTLNIQQNRPQLQDTLLPPKKAEPPTPVEVDEYGILKKKKGKRTAERVQIFIRDNPSTCEELAICMKNLGVATKQKFCFLQGNYFIYVSEALPKLLKIDMSAILRNCEIGLHFIQMQNEDIYASKYGMLQMIAASKEPVSLRFQDYIFEVLQKIEQNGIVKMEELESRPQLIAEVNKLNFTDELYDTQMQLQKAEKEYRSLNAEFICIMDELQVKTNLLQKAEEEIKTLSKQNYELRDIAEKLAKYVKLTKSDNETAKKLCDETEMLDISLDLDEQQDQKELHSEAKNAKKRLKSIKDIKPISANSSKEIQHFITLSEQQSVTWSLMRSLYPTEPTEYQWKLVQNIKDLFKEVSQKVLSDLDEGIYEEPINGIINANAKDIMLMEISKTGWVWYDDVLLNTREVKILSSIFADKSYTEDFIRNLFC